jgi:hypothetical protein
MAAFRNVCLALSSVLVLSSCAPAPVKINAGDHCYRCRRYITNERLGSEMISGDKARFIAKFRDPGCMAKYLAAHPEEKGTIYVTDYAGGKMMGPDGAYYVAEVVDQNTGEQAYRAYRDEGDARAAAAELKTTVVTWNTVLEQGR